MLVLGLPVDLVHGDAAGMDGFEYLAIYGSRTEFFDTDELELNWKRGTPRRLLIQVITPCMEIICFSFLDFFLANMAEIIMSEAEDQNYQ